MPLSGGLRSGAFGLETGRSRIMAFRRQNGFIPVGCDPIGQTLNRLIVNADRPICPPARRRPYPIGDPLS